MNSENNNIDRRKFLLSELEREVVRCMRQSCEDHQKAIAWFAASAQRQCASQQHISEDKVEPFLPAAF